MKPEKRQQEVVSLLRALQRELTVEEIATHFGTSTLTVRRDLDSLVKAGFIVRTYGGCIVRSRFDTAYQRQVGRNFNLKQAIGRAAADLVKRGEVILIDDGSTTFHLASNLEMRAPLTVVTNSIGVISSSRYWAAFTTGTRISWGGAFLSGFLKCCISMRCLWAQTPSMMRDDAWCRRPKSHD